MATETFGRGKTRKLPGLTAVRENKGLSHRELGLISDVHHTTIWRIEKGAAANRDTVRRLARALKVGQEELMAEPPEDELASLAEDDEGSIEAKYVHRFTMGGEESDPMFEAALVDKKLQEFREADGTDEAFREIATELLLLGKARGKELA